MVSPSYAMDSQIKAQDLASTILSSSSPPQISTACSAIESFLQKHVPDQTRSFFAITFPALICKIFGFDDSSSSSQKPLSSGGWIDQIHASNDAGLAGKVFDLLSPSGILLSSIFAVDRHSLVKYVFPVERLPEWARVVLQSERDPSILSDLCPLFKGRVKEDPISGSFQVHLNVFEYYMFWFAYYPVCKGNCDGSGPVVVRKNRRFRLENWTSSLPVLASAARLSGQKPECNLYTRLLYAYLRSFVPNFCLIAYQPYRSSLLHYSSASDNSVRLQAEFLVYTLIHFWLVDNDFLALRLNFCRSFNMSFPFRAVLGETPPTAGLGEVVKLLVKYLNTSVVVSKEGADLMEYNRTQKWRVMGSADSVKSRTTGPLLSYGNSFGSWNVLMQRPLYRFILRTFLFCPIGTSIKNASQVFSVWVTYLEPWKIGLEEFAELDALECRSSDISRNENGQSPVKTNPTNQGYQSEGLFWQGYVESNYLFYSSLLVHFLGFAHKFLHANAETIIEMVLKVLSILTSSKELMEHLKKIDASYHSKSSGSSSAMFDSSYKCVPSIREQLEDWEDGLCESDVDGSFLHENWNKDLRLFGEGEDGGKQLLQLLILRAEHEIQAISGDNLGKNLRTLDSVKAGMGSLFGDMAGKPALVVPELMHSRDEVFTPKHPGVGKRTWADVQYKGDWMRRPISDGEVAWLARLLIRLSIWLNETLGLDRAESVPVGLVCDYADVPGDNAGHVGGLKEALWTVLSSVGLWLVFLGHAAVRFMRERGLRINLRVLASKKFVMILILYAVFSVLKKACGLYLYPSSLWASLVR
ncbi:uncharacterized protein LOC131248240 [Magnolia sinica]|uniref:uncharacterized protein LOC131248240 n=1 Tax=Magnolia sinica TaxID=86752 RepID=UPI0026590D99|nr:uncharacterized protein LOC131248240 [Magnolia sinica]